MRSADVMFDKTLDAFLMNYGVNRAVIAHQAGSIDDIIILW